MPLRLALASAALLVLFITRNGHMIVMTLLSTFVIAVIVHHLWQLADRQARSRSCTRRHAVLRLAQGDPGYWGGQIAHIGIAVLALGIAASANLVTSGTIGLAPGESARFAGYELVYQAPFTRQEPNRTVIGARIGSTQGRRTNRRSGTTPQPVHGFAHCHPNAGNSFDVHGRSLHLAYASRRFGCHRRCVGISDAVDDLAGRVARRGRCRILVAGDPSLPRFSSSDSCLRE